MRYIYVIFGEISWLFSIKLKFCTVFSKDVIFEDDFSIRTLNLICLIFLVDSFIITISVFS